MATQLSFLDVAEADLDTPQPQQVQPEEHPVAERQLSAETQFSDEQLRALEAHGEVMVCAAAGSGKTRVLVGRILRAVLEEQVPLHGIVAVTYTEKAAQEMRERVAHALHRAGSAELVAQLEHARIGTIHSIAAALLRQYAHSAGIDPAFSVIDSGQAEHLKRLASRDSLEQQSRDEHFLEMRARYGDESLEQLMLTAYDAAMQRLDRQVTFAAYEDQVLARDAHHLDLLLRDFEQRYRHAKERVGSLDFDDLQHLALAVSDDEQVAAQLRFSVRRLLVDEFQDTNQVQTALLDRLGSGETFVVGDEWQSIYRFRRADVDVFRRRAEISDPLPMRGNYRSRPQVLALVNHIFAQQFGERFQPVRPARSHDGDEAACELLLVHDDGAAGDLRELEAEAVAERIAQLVRSGVDPSGVAVLLARQTHADKYERALRLRGVPVLRAASRGYYDQQQVRDVTALLAWATNRHDERAALAVLSSPYVGLQWSELWDLRTAAETLWEALEGSPTERVSRALRLREEIHQIHMSASLVDAVEHAVRGSGYETLVLARPDGARRVANMRKLIELAAEAQGMGVSDLSAFLDIVESHRSIGAAQGEANIADEQSGAVRILTIHAAKGLEFPHVFVCDTANRGRVQPPEMLVDSDGTAHWVGVDRLGCGRIIPEQLNELRRADIQASREEEQRLFYVALTRAQERLTVSGCVGKRATGPLVWMARSLGLDLENEAKAPPPPGRMLHDSLPLHVTRVSGAPPTTHVADEPQARPFQLAQPWRPTPQPTRDEAPESQSSHAATIDADAAAQGQHAHEVLARLLTASVVGEPDHELWQIAHDAGVAHVAQSETFAQLVRLRARAEVPILVNRDGGVRTGRIDALAVDEDRWWVVDYKHTLPAGDDAAWAIHDEQLSLYAQAAFAAGARCVELTLVSLSEPGRCVSRVVRA